MHFFPTESECGGMNLHFAKLILPNLLSGVAVDVSACFPYIRMLWGQVPKAGLGFQWITTLHIYKVKLMSYFQRFGLENIEV